MESLKALERQESEFQSSCDAKRSELEAEITELEEKLSAGYNSYSLSDDLSESLEKLDLAKRELAARLREILSVKQKLGDGPSHLELIQYERRFSELYAHIQDKHRQTKKYYATYNALLEIKELMLKENSLLNSISSQKLEKVQLGLREEQKICDAIKERYAVAIAEQRRCHSLLKAFLVECAKNERLWSQSSV